MLIVGLGNPGRRYERTRHNVGFELVDLLVGRWPVDRLPSDRGYVLWSASFEDRTVYLMKPMTYMNRSGAPVGRFVRGQGLPPGECLVVVDDMALEIGRLRFRRRGSTGGHNGLESIEAALGTSEYPRLRIGVGPAPASVEWVDFVLTDVDDTGERERLDEALVRGVEGIEMVLREGLDRAMSIYNR